MLPVNLTFCRPTRILLYSAFLSLSDSLVLPKHWDYIVQFGYLDPARFHYADCFTLFFGPEHVSLPACCVPTCCFKAEVTSIHLLVP